MLKSTVLKYYGTGAAVARALKISSAAVTQWPDVIPEKQAYRLQVLTKRVLKVDPSLYEKNCTGR